VRSSAVHVQRLVRAPVDAPAFHVSARPPAVWSAKLQRYAEMRARVLTNCARSFGTPPFLEATCEEFNEHGKILRSVVLDKCTERFGDRCPLRGGRLRTGNVRTGPCQFNEILNLATCQISVSGSRGPFAISREPGA
jgi:hypothetical protein